MIIKKLIACALVSTACAQVMAEDSANKYSNLPGVDCVINPYKVADIASPVAGVIETLFVERSQQVSANQVVVQLDADVERASVDLARYRAGIQSEIKLGQVNMKFDQRRHKRINSLGKQQAISMEKIDEAEREAGLSKWKLQQAQELAEVRQLELKRAEEQLRQKSIRAPFDGFVLDTFKDRGEYVEDQSIFRLAQLNPLVIEAIVPMENFGQIKVGMEAEILPEAFSEEKLVGKVSIVDRIGDTASNTFGVRLVMPNPENRIPAGIKCVVKFFEQDDEKIAAATSVPESGMVEKAMVETMLGKVAPAEELYADITGFKTVENHVELDAASNVVVDDSIPDNYVEVVPSEKQLNITEEVIEQKYKLPQQLEKTLERNQEINSEKNSRKKKPSSYLVVTQQPETRPLTNALISKLRDSGVYDLQEMDYGPHKGYISLGMYAKRSYAEKRQQALAGLGFTSYIRNRN